MEDNTKIMDVRIMSSMRYQDDNLLLQGLFRFSSVNIISNTRRYTLGVI